MEIGIHGFDLDDAQYYRDLGVTWTKWGTDICPIFRDERAGMAAARELGMNVVMDLRMGRERVNELLLEALARGQDEERAVREVCLTVAGDCQAFVARHKDLCSDWEVWGECYCPWVADGVFDKVPYTSLLKDVYLAIKAADPKARVWTGGNGTNLDPEWVDAILQDGCGASFDVLNLHPFYISLRDLIVTSAHLESSLGYMRTRLQEDGRDQPFAATEWGHPHTLVRRQLRSNVIGGLQSLDYEEACEWYERDLRAFERHGFQVVIVHELHDRWAKYPDPCAGMFWGNYCGLLDNMNQRKPTYEIIQRWAHKGRGA